MELEKKASDVKAELEKALEENALLQKQVNELSEFQSLPNTVEIQQREVNKKKIFLEKIKFSGAGLPYVFFILCFMSYTLEFPIQ